MAAEKTKKSSRRSSPRKERDSRKVPFVDNGPPREVIITIHTPKEPDADALLDELLDDDDDVSSLAHTEDRKQKIDIGKIVGDADSNEDKARTDSVGIAAARARYKAHSAPGDKPSAKTALIHFDAKEMADPTRGIMEDLSLGSNAHVTNSNQPIEVIDVEDFKVSKRTMDDNTSKTASGTESPSLHMMKPRFVKRESGIDTEEEDDDDASDDEQTAGTKDLLARVHDRLTISKLKEEIDQLKDVVDSKNTELEILAGQLRRAVETKCDLVLAHTEMERHHEHNLKAKDDEAHELMKANFGLMEGLADVEKELLNEIVKLQMEASEAKKQHIQELQDWERMHKNEMLERDCEIARLREEVRKLLLKTSPNNGGGVTRELIEC